jgi:glutathione S-transferase
MRAAVRCLEVHKGILARRQPEPRLIRSQERLLVFRHSRLTLRIKLNDAVLHQTTTRLLNCINDNIEIASRSNTSIIALKRRKGITIVLTIFGYRASINVRKVLWLCEELDLSYRTEDWGGGSRPTSSPEFLSLNPVGMVPVIDDDGFILWESNTILRYLAASRSRADLLPEDARQRATIEKWMDWQVSDFNSSWRTAYQGLVRKKPEYQDKTAIAQSLETFSDLVGRVAAEIDRKGGYICGNSFTLADIPIGLSIHRWRALPAAKPNFPVIEDYYERLCLRAGFNKFGLNGGP